MDVISGLTLSDLSALRTLVSEKIGIRRFAHTLGVEEEISRLGALYLPREIPRLRVAALLHDITKEWTAAKQLAFCAERGITLSAVQRAAPKVLHSLTGSLVAARDFRTYTDPGILRAISLHTTGGAGMTVFDELLYLSDYIDPTRTYEDCIRLRNTFHRGYVSAPDKVRHLHETVIVALRMTVDDLRNRNAPVFPQTTAAIRYLAEKLSESGKNS